MNEQEIRQNERENILNDLYKNIYIESLASEQHQEVAKYVKGFFKIAIRDYANRFNISLQDNEPPIAQ